MRLGIAELLQQLGRTRLAHMLDDGFRIGQELGGLDAADVLLDALVQQMGDGGDAAEGALVLGQAHEDHRQVGAGHEVVGHRLVHVLEELSGLLLPHVVARLPAVVGRHMVLERRVVQRTLVPVVHERELLAERVEHVAGQLHALERAEVAVDEREAVGRKPQ